VVVDPIFWCGTCAACQTGQVPACSSLKLVGVDVDGGFAEYAAVKEFMLYKIPESIPDRYAALVEILSIGFHACRRAGLKESDTVAVWGAGRVGQVILRACRTITPHALFAVDVLPGRLEKAKKAYPDIVTVDATKEDPVETIHAATRGRGVDVAFEAVGHAATIPGRFEPVRACIKAIRGGGMVAVLGMADDPVALVMKELILKEAKIVASRVTHGEFQTAVAHLAQGGLHPEELVSAEMPASQAQEAFQMLEREPEKHLKVLLKL
jgi:threonine dehydrogenase-like Zn-dependent dehydrogenase